MVSAKSLNRAITVSLKLGRGGSHNRDVTYWKMFMENFEVVLRGMSYNMEALNKVLLYFLNICEFPKFQE